MFLNNCTVCVFLCVQMLVFWRKWCDKSSYLILFCNLQFVIKTLIISVQVTSNTLIKQPFVYYFPDADVLSLCSNKRVYIIMYCNLDCDKSDNLKKNI